MPTPPIAEKRPHILEQHGRKREDPYYWLRDENWQQVMRDPDVLQADIRHYLEAENDFTTHVMGDTDALQETLFAEMKGRIKEDDSTVSSRHGPFEYFVRYETGGQHPIFCRRPVGKDGSEQILLNGDTEAAKHNYFQIGSLDHSPDHTKIAFSLDTNGSEFYTVYVRDLATGEQFADELPNGHGDFVWTADSKGIFYTILDDNHRPVKILHHVLGTDIATDRVVYEEKDPSFFISVGETESRRFIAITAHDHTTSEVWLIPQADPTAAPMVVSPREEGHEYDVSDWGDHLLIHTNCDGAEDFKIMTAPLASPQRDNWADWVPHESGRLILNMLVFKDYVVSMERVDALPRIIIRQMAEDLSIADSHLIDFPEEAYDLGASSGYEFDTDNLRFSYSSPTTPAQVFDYDMRNRARTLRKTQEVPSGHTIEDYVTRRILATARDGETVPVTLLYRKTTPIDGSAPLLLYGYGSYGISMPASFATARLSLVDRGFIYAIAHIRGGKDKGYRWYTDGKLDKKTNTFTDFIDCAEALIGEGFTSAGNIVAHGGSAGGMLMGAVANMAPALFGGIIAEVPFVDVLTTICDDTLPLTPPEWGEWGNPITSEQAFETIQSYSPYDNVTAQNYPAILALAGLTDPRVTYWEPAKWIAKLRELNTGDATILLKTNMDAGHGGASGRFDRLKEVALSYAFALRLFDAQ